MKKIILMAVATTLAISLVACTGKTDKAKQPTPTQNSSKSESQKTATIQTYMGEVSGKVGNDITLSLGKLILENDGSDKVTMKIDKNGNQEVVEGDTDADAGGETIMFKAPDDAGAEGDKKPSEDGKIEKLPIEFTGEVKDFTIPAGAKIVNAAGKDITLDGIKKGSLIQLIVNKSTGVVERLMVW